MSPIGVPLVQQSLVRCCSCYAVPSPITTSSRGWFSFEDFFVLFPCIQFLIAVRLSTSFLGHHGSKKFLGFMGKLVWRSPSYLHTTCVIRRRARIFLSLVGVRKMDTWYFLQHQQPGWAGVKSHQDKRAEKSFPPAGVSPGSLLGNEPALHKRKDFGRITVFLGPLHTAGAPT